MNSLCNNVLTKLSLYAPRAYILDSHASSYDNQKTVERIQGSLAADTRKVFSLKTILLKVQSYTRYIQPYYGWARVQYHLVSELGGSKG